MKVDRATLGKYDKDVPGWYEGIVIEMDEEEFLALYQVLDNTLVVDDSIPEEIVDFITKSEGYYSEILTERGLKD